ncbi:TraB/GumN family protein, partial [Flavobacterium sp.]|uniref:TraB/GumN family protein n=1 Tax=Flavobacterium sp. TaxID=239 RepID=UPI0037C1042E
MKKILFLLTFLSISAFAQEKKYQSLFWEISGNGLAKKSYMYGTMHVSDKVSFHLSDSFFEKLMASDFIANESEPNTWTELYDLYGFYQSTQTRRNFYSNFYTSPIEKDYLYSLFRGTNYNLIGLLSRTNQANQEFQEETYLDMFIYRTGRKYGKKTLGLEDVKSTTLNIEKAEAEMDRSEVDENKQAILKILKKRSYVDVLRDAYREKDLDLLDTLNMLSSPKSYNKAMLFDRNEGMSASMDSIMKTGSLFAAIGAAHLPGKNGMIEILRRKGYTVTPILSEYTEKGKKLKKQIEDYFVKPVFEINTTSDEMISLPLFPLVLKNGENLESPDLGNGGHINVKRMLLQDFITKKDEKFNHKTLDSLFFENIPGEILEIKSYQEKNNFVYDIKSKTKTGKNERYRYYITPLEIIAVIMSGEG